MITITLSKMEQRLLTSWLEYAYKQNFKNSNSNRLKRLHNTTFIHALKTVISKIMLLLYDNEDVLRVDELESLLRWASGADGCTYKHLALNSGDYIDRDTLAEIYTVFEKIENIVIPLLDDYVDIGFEIIPDINFSNSLRKIYISTRYE